MWNVQRGFLYSSTLHLFTKFTGNGATAGVPGPNVFYLIGNDANLGCFEEQYHMKLPELAIRGVFIGSQVMETVGQASISCQQSGFDAQFSFKPKSNFEFEGAIRKKPHPNVIYKLSGTTDRAIFIENQGADDSKRGTQELFVDVKSKLKVPKKLKSLSEQKKYESRKVWHNVTFPLIKGDDATANVHKDKIENIQRELVKTGKKSDDYDSYPVLFRLVPDDTLAHPGYEYIHLSELLRQIRAAAAAEKNGSS